MSLFQECKDALSADINIIDNKEQVEFVLGLLNEFLTPYGTINFNKLMCTDYLNIENALNSFKDYTYKVYVVADDSDIPIFQTNLKLALENFYDISALSPKIFIFNENEIFAPLFPNESIRYGLLNPT